MISCLLLRTLKNVRSFKGEMSLTTDLAFFARYRDGQDHYNLFFFNRLRQVEFGLVLFKESLVRSGGE